MELLRFFTPRLTKNGFVGIATLLIHLQMMSKLINIGDISLILIF